VEGKTPEGNDAQHRQRRKQVVKPTTNVRVSFLLRGVALKRNYVAKGLESV